MRNSFARDISKLIRAVCVEVDKAEGDDVIYVCCEKYHHNYDSVVLITRDSDMNQLLKNDKLTIFNHITKEITQCEDPDSYLQIKILSGDTSDSIPGIHIPGKKTKLGEAGAKTFFEALNCDCYTLAKEQGWEKQYIRNRQLIDISFCPNDIQTEILEKLKTTSHTFPPFWEVESLPLPSKTIQQIVTMKQVGFYVMNNKEDIRNIKDFFLNEKNKVDELFSEPAEQSKVLERVGSSGRYISEEIMDVF